VEEQPQGTLQHLKGFGVAQSLPMQSRQVVPETSVLPFHPCHIGLADQLVAVLNERRIDLPTISDIQETVPALDDQP
jgi:hypothetical protein